jgi:hypothetical protein
MLLNQVDYPQPFYFSFKTQFPLSKVRSMEEHRCHEQRISLPIPTAIPFDQDDRGWNFARDNARGPTYPRQAIDDDALAI